MRHAMAAVLMAAVLGAASEAWAQGEPAAVPAPGEKAAPSTPAASPADVPVKRVTLFSSGVGFFEHDGTIDGNGHTVLRFDPPQINDVLKSLVVFDRDGGTVRNVTYPANNSVNKTLQGFQVDLSTNPTLPDILNQLRGTPVAISVGDERIEGTILGVESKDQIVGKPADGKTVSTYTVNVITDRGIRAVPLDQVKNLEVKDEKIRREMKEALAAIAQSRDQSKRAVTVNFEGAGKRRVGMGYLVETPIWKTSYRLMLPEAGSKDSAKLQGWAIVENQTDNDWKDVNLSLVGGRPLGYIELLYQPLFSPRPVEQPAVGAIVKPQTYDDGQAFAVGGGVGGEVVGRGLPSADIVPPTYDLQSITASGGTTGGGSGGGGMFATTTQQQNFVSNFNQTARENVDYTHGVAAAAQLNKIGAMFHYDIDKVTLPRQQSSMIPIISDAVDCRRVSIFNSQVLPTRALRGIRLTNNTGKYLLGGPLTVLDTVKAGTSYAGDAKIDDIPPGQSRLLSYAVDQEILVEVSADEAGKAIISGAISKGVLHMKYRDRMVREYTLDNKGDADKTVVVEHPITAGYTLKEPASAEATDALYRMEVALPAKKTAKLRVVQECVTAEEVALATLQGDSMNWYLQQGEISAKVRDMLRSVGDKRDAVAGLDRQTKKKQEDRARILEEQANIRENIRVLPAGSKSQEDAISELTARDAALKQANADLSALETAAEKARGDLANYLSTMVIE